VGHNRGDRRLIKVDVARPVEWILAFSDGLSETASNLSSMRGLTLSRPADKRRHSIEGASWARSLRPWDGPSSAQGMVPLEHPPPAGRGRATRCGPSARTHRGGRQSAGSLRGVINGRLDASVRRRSFGQHPSLAGASVTMAAT
jgi:hypothetical protein